MPPPARTSHDQPTPPAAGPELSKGPGQRRWRWLIRLAGTVLLVFFLWKFLNLDLALVAAELARANLWLVGLACLLVGPFIALKAWRWQVLLAGLGIRTGFGRAYRLYALGLAAGSFTPGQSGDFIKAWHLKSDGHRLGTALVSIALDRLFDLAVLGLLAVSGLLVLGTDFVSALPALLILLAGALAGLVALATPAIRDRLLGLAVKLVPRREPPVAGGQLLQAEPIRPSGLNYGRVFVLTLLGSGLALLRVWLLALALGINLGLLEVVAASSLATVASLLPVSVGGIGARDLALAGILGRLGYSTHQAVGLSSFLLLLQAVNLLAGYLIWLARPAASK